MGGGGGDFRVAWEQLHMISPPFTEPRGRTYVMITYVSKENNLGPEDKIRYIWGLNAPSFI